MADEDGDDADINPFDGFPMFGDISRMLSGQGPLNWDAARQFAIVLGEWRRRRWPAVRHPGRRPHQPNVDPDGADQVSASWPTSRGCTSADVMEHRGTWQPSPISGHARSSGPQQTLEAYRPLFTELASSLGPASTTRTLKRRTTRWRR